VEIHHWWNKSLVNETHGMIRNCHFRFNDCRIRNMHGMHQMKNMHEIKTLMTLMRVLWLPRRWCFKSSYFLPWRWRRHRPLKRRYPTTILQGITTRRPRLVMALFSRTTVMLWRHLFFMLQFWQRPRLLEIIMNAIFPSYIACSSCTL